MFKLFKKSNTTDLITISPPQKRTKIVQTLSRGLAPLINFFTGGSNLEAITAGIIERNADDFYKQAGVILRRKATLASFTDPVVESFLNLLETNVIGQMGFILQVDDTKNLPKDLADSIEMHFKEWAKSPTIDGKHNLASALRLLQRTEAVDGEILVRMIDAVPADKLNPYNFAIQLLAPAWLDDQKNQNPVKAEDNFIKLGIEFNQYGRPIVYHFNATNASNKGLNTKGIQVQADDILHKFVSKQIGQTRGITWLAPVLEKLKHFDGYTNAVVIAERVAASKMGFLVEKDPDRDYATDEVQQDIEIEVAPATITQLPKGMEFQEWNPTASNANFAEVSTSILRQVAAGLKVSYNALTSDLTGVNYSSLRSGMLQERNAWRLLQQDMIEKIIQPIYKRWLKNAILAKKIALPGSLTIEEILQNTRWISRGWDWVDPLKDTQATVLGVNSGLTSRTQALAETGEDWETVIKQLAKEQELAKKYGIVLNSQLDQKPTASNTDTSQSTNTDGTGDTQNTGDAQANQ